MNDELCGLIKFDDKGLIPAVIQDAKTGRVLTLCYLNKEALHLTLKTGKVHVFRRSRQELMVKGGTSGNYQLVKELFIDCEGNSLLFRVEQQGGACHAGYFTCYYRQIRDNGRQIVIREEKVFDPSSVYK